MLKQKTPAAKENNKKPRRFWVYITIILLLLFVVAYIIWTFLQKPVISDIRVGTKEPSADIIKKKEQKLYQGKYLAFSYPGDYQELTHAISAEKPIRENIFLSATDLEGQKVAEEVEER